MVTRSSLARVNAEKPILSYIKFANRIAWRLSEILRLLQLNLFERRPLRELLGSGNESPPDRSSQLTMKFTWT